MNHTSDRLSEKPVSVRFTESMLAEISALSSELTLSKQDIIRLSVAAGLKAFRKIGIDGLTEFLASKIKL